MVKCQTLGVPEEGICGLSLLFKSYSMEFGCLLSVEKSNWEKQQREEGIESATA